MDIIKIEIITDGGPWAEHNMPCAICLSKHAVLLLDEGIFQPCWGCQNKWKLKKIKSKWWKILFGKGAQTVLERVE